MLKVILPVAFATAALGVFFALQGEPGAVQAAGHGTEQKVEGKTPKVAPHELGTAGDEAEASHGTHGAISRSVISGLPMTAPVIIVNDVTFTRADLERAISQHAVVAGIPPLSIDAQTRDALEQPAYEKLIERQLLGNEARRRGLWPVDADIAKQREKLVATLPQGKTLDEALKAMNTDEQHFMTDLASDVAIGALFEALKKEQPAPADDVLQKIYNENIDKFRTKDTASAMHILVRLAKDASPEDVKAALAKATAVRKEVAGKDVATFKKVASEKSEDPSAKANGGDLGTFARGDMVPMFEEVAFKLKEGEVSQPIRSDFGYHVIRGGGSKKGEQKSFADVKGMIADREIMKSFMGKVDVMIDGLRQAAKITRLQEPVASPLNQGEPGPGTRVPGWKPKSGNVKPGSASPHGG